ncbi:MAG: 2-iminoacetate synthase ThiH [Coriobacteriaceae bacterium]|nr:2-iminoacetate synthase ThiH [Coriobacteriaceae bacterium]
MIDRNTDHMAYQPGMEEVSSDILDEVLERRAAYRPEDYDAQDVERALAAERLDVEDFAALLSPSAAPYLEQMAQRARQMTRRYFGNSVLLFTPLYIANHCENLCVYCGYNAKNKIKRARLDGPQIASEMEAISASGLQEILILTGESRSMSPVDYIAAACREAHERFRTVGVEVYPMNSDEYAQLHEAGADYVTVFQETYNPDTYEVLHLGGHKRIFPYRLGAQERALMGGMRGVGFGALLGLDDFRSDAFATGLHARLVQRKYPQAEIAFSCPRLRPTPGDVGFTSHPVSEAELLQVICSYRLFMPFASITISTRERAGFRDHAIGIAATKISAGVSTAIGEHGEQEKQGDEQFEIADPRSVDEVVAAIEGQGLQPVMHDYLYVG